MFKKLILTISAIAVLSISVPFSSFAESFISPPDIKGHWAESLILKEIKRGSLVGYNDGTFKPENNITNAEYLSIILKVAQVQVPLTIPGDKWYANVYEKALEYGLIDKKDPNDAVAFYPEDKINREQACRIVSLVLMKKEQYSYDEKLTPYIKGYFKDYSSINKFYIDGVQNSVASGIISGNPDKTFKPTNRLTRAEATVVLGKLFEPNTRKYFNVKDLYVIKIEGQIPTSQGYDKPYVNYIDKKYGDFVNIFNIMNKENEDMTRGFVEFIDNKEEKILSASLYTDLDTFKSNIFKAIDSEHFSISMFYDKNQKAGFEKYQIEIDDYNGNASKSPDTFAAVLKYLVGKEYPTILAGFNDMQNGKIPPVGKIYQTSYSFNNRTIAIVRWPSCTSIYVTMKVNEPLKTIAQIEDIPSKQQCSSTFEGLKLDGPITLVCNETVNTIIGQIGKRKDIVILDVRTKEEYSAGRIPYAINIPVANLKAEMWKLKPYKYVLVYCKAGTRSTQASEILSANGKTVMNFIDGFDKFVEL